MSISSVRKTNVCITTRPCFLLIALPCARWHAPEIAERGRRQGGRVTTATDGRWRRRRRWRLRCIRREAGGTGRRVRKAKVHGWVEPSVRVAHTPLQMLQQSVRERQLRARHDEQTRQAGEQTDWGQMRDCWAPSGGDPALIPPPLAPPGDRTRSGGAGRIDSQRVFIARKTSCK